MFNAVMIGILVLDGWGMIGICKSFSLHPCSPAFTTWISHRASTSCAMDPAADYGIRTQSFGFHHEWEFWLYQVFYGLFVCPWYSYSQIMISEVTPRGKEFLFFNLFSIMGKTSAFIGPIVSSAIIDASPTGNNSLPFYFLFGLTLLSLLLLAFFVNLKESRREQAAFLEREAAAKKRRASIVSGDFDVSSQEEKIDGSRRKTKL